MTGRSDPAEEKRGATDLSDCRVAVSRAERYDTALLCETIREQFSLLGLSQADFEGKRVVIKPNLLNDKGPDHAATTHPAVVSAAVRLMKRYGAQVIIAESSPGSYDAAHMEKMYRASQIYEDAVAEGAVFNFDPGQISVPAPDGRVCKRFELISPLFDADLILNLCKLKTHGLTKMTCAVKNFYGAVPGMLKVEMHARYAEQELFSEMLVDLCELICRSRPVISICDAVLAMEGDGPGSGDPRWLYTLMSSCNPFALDEAAAELIGFGDSVLTLPPSKERGLCPASAADLKILGDDLQTLRVQDFRAPQSQGSTRLLRYLPDFMKPHPVVITERCIGCGICARSCPEGTIRISERKAKIGARNCIRCFCCQELCPQKAVAVKKSRLLKLVTERR